MFFKKTKLANSKNRNRLLNRNAFTLIELLAIIVILAIIAVITVPIILNIIENSKVGAATDSAYGYKDSINKWYVSKLQEDSQYQLADSYTISSDGKLGDIEIPLSGNKPSGGYLNYSNNKLTGGCLVFGDYVVTFDSNGNASEAKKGTCEIPVPSFADDSWADIKANLTSNRNFYPIGSEKIIEMDRDNNGTNEYYKLRLVNTEPCNGYTGSNTSCGVVIEFVTTIGNHNMNSSSTNEGGWKESEMRTYLNSDVLELLPNDLKSVIIGTAPIVSGSGSGGVSDDVVAPGDKLYLLSGKEVGLSLSYVDKKEDADTKILSYYTENTGNGPRIKYSTTTSEGQDSSASLYWLRSAFSLTTDGFYRVYSDGSNSSHFASTTGGVVPAFRILD